MASLGCEAGEAPEASGTGVARHSREHVPARGGVIGPHGDPPRQEARLDDEPDVALVDPGPSTLAKVRALRQN